MKTAVLFNFFSLPCSRKFLETDKSDWPGLKIRCILSTNTHFWCAIFPIWHTYVKYLGSTRDWLDTPLTFDLYFLNWQLIFSPSPSCRSWPWTVWAASVSPSRPSAWRSRCGGSTSPSSSTTTSPQASLSSCHGQVRDYGVTLLRLVNLSGPSHRENKSHSAKSLDFLRYDIADEAWCAETLFYWG